MVTKYWHVISARGNNNQLVEFYNNSVSCTPIKHAMHSPQHSGPCHCFLTKDLHDDVRNKRSEANDKRKCTPGQGK